MCVFRIRREESERMRETSESCHGEAARHGWDSSSICNLESRRDPLSAGDLHTKASNTLLLRDAAEGLNILAHTCRCCRREVCFKGRWWMDREEDGWICWDCVCMCVCEFGSLLIVLGYHSVLTIKSYYLVKIQSSQEAFQLYTVAAAVHSDIKQSFMFLQDHDAT